MLLCLGSCVLNVDEIPWDRVHCSFFPCRAAWRCSGEGRGDRIPLSPRGQRGVEGGVEDSDMQKVRQERPGRADASEVGRVVQRSKGCKLIDGGLDGVIDASWRAEAPTSVHYAMRNDGRAFSSLGEQLGERLRQGSGVPAWLHALDMPRGAGLAVERDGERELDGAASAVDDEDEHEGLQGPQSAPVAAPPPETSLVDRVERSHAGVQRFHKLLAGLARAFGVQQGILELGEFPRRQL